MTARTLPTPTQAPPSTLPTLLSTDQDQLAPSATLAAAPWDGEELLRSLQRLGVAHDLQESDLTLPDLQQAASSSSSSSSSASRMSMLLSRLSLLLSDLSRLQEDQIRTHLPTLLDRASGVQSLEGQVREVRRLLADVEVGVEKLSNPTRRSLVRLERDQRRLRRLHSVQDLLGGAARYVSTARRLETHLQTLFDGDDDGDVVGDAQCRAMVDAAHCLESLASLTAPPLTSLAFIASYSPSITAARGQVVDKMESSIVAGLRDLSPSLLSTSLQTADVLGLLPDLVSDLLRDLTDVVKRCVVKALGSIDRREWDAALADDEAASSSSPSSSPAPYRSKRHQQQGQQRDMRRVTRAQDAFCAHFDTLMTTEMTAVCSKIYLLQRVLGLMRAARTRKEDDGGEGGDEEEDEGGESNSRTLLDDSVKILGEPPTLLFWRTLSTSLESNLSSRVPASFWATPLHVAHTAHHQQHAARRGTRFHPTWESHLSRVVDYFFEKTAVWTGINASGAASGVEGSGNRAPEDVFLRRSIGLS